MYEEAYKSIIEKAKKLQAKEGDSSSQSGGIMSRPKKKTKDGGAAKEERWEDIAAQYVLFFHKQAEDIISQVKSSVKKGDK